LLDSAKIAAFKLNQFLLTDLTVKS